MNGQAAAVQVEAVPVGDLDEFANQDRGAVLGKGGRPDDGGRLAVGGQEIGQGQAAGDRGQGHFHVGVAIAVGVDLQQAAVEGGRSRAAAAEGAGAVEIEIAGNDRLQVDHVQSGVEGGDGIAVADRGIQRLAV